MLVDSGLTYSQVRAGSGPATDAAAGAFFGYYSALKASRSNPIDRRAFRVLRRLNALGDRCTADRCAAGCCFALRAGCGCGCLGCILVAGLPAIVKFTDSLRRGIVVPPIWCRLGCFHCASAGNLYPVARESHRSVPTTSGWPTDCANNTCCSEPSAKLFTSAILSQL